MGPIHQFLVNKSHLTYFWGLSGKIWVLSSNFFYVSLWDQNKIQLGVITYIRKFINSFLHLSNPINSNEPSFYKFGVQKSLQAFTRAFKIISKAFKGRFFINCYRNLRFIIMWRVWIIRHVIELIFWCGIEDPCISIASYQILRPISTSYVVISC